MIIERTYESKQVQQLPVETHICYSYMDGDRIIMHDSTQVPWHVRRQVAKILNVKQNKVHIVKERVGGGYGSKQDILLEDVCAWATYTTGVRSISTILVKKSSFVTRLVTLQKSR